MKKLSERMKSFLLPVAFGLVMIALIVALMLLRPVRVDAQNCQQWKNPCCQPICQQETRVVFYPVYIREEIEEKEEVEMPACANHFVEFGFNIQANEVGDTGFPNHNLLEANISLRSKRLQGFLDIAGGFSFGYIQDQGAVGINLKLGVPFSNPGPSFDLIRASWMVNNSITLSFKQVGLRVPLLKVGPFGYIQALGYVGVEAFAFYSEPTGYTEGYGILLGAAAEVCREQLSFSCFIEFQACQQKHECSTHKGTVLIKVGAQLWLF